MLIMMMTMDEVLFDVGAMSDAPSFEVADSDAGSSSGSGGAASSTPGGPHQILEFFEMCCALITTLAK